MERHYCTLFDRNYLGKALALFRSLETHERRAYRVHAVCLDEVSRILLERLALPNVEPVPLHAIEHGDARLLAAKRDRSTVEYYWTLTATIILRLLERNPGMGALTYLDADLCFFSSPDPIFAEFEGASVLIHGHRFSPGLAWLEKQSGKYNVGLLCFREDARALRVLEWWRDRCLEWCKVEYADGKMGDQMYLNDWPSRFEGVKELMHPGAGLAPWNHQQYRIDAGGPSVDGKPVVFYHFHALALANPAVLVPVKHVHYPLSRSILRAVYLPYADALLRSHRDLQAALPGFSAGFVEENLLQAEHTFMVRPGIRVPDGLPHRVERAGDWTFYLSDHVSVPDSPAGVPARREGPAAPRPASAFSIVDLEAPAAAVPAPAPSAQAPGPSGGHAGGGPEGWTAVPRAGSALEILGRAEAMVDHGDLRQARQVLEALEKLAPEDPRIGHAMGRLLHKEGDREGGYRRLVKSLQANPMDRRCLLTCLDIMSEEGFYDSIKTLTAAYLDSHPDDLEAMRALARREEGWMDQRLSRCLRIDTNYREKDYLVTALVSTYKSEAFMEECLSDLEGQTIADRLEIVVVDADSPEGERRVVERFQRRYDNIRYIRTPERIGIYPAWNLCIRASRGRYLTPFSTNDRLSPRAYQDLSGALRERPDVSLVYGDSHLTHEPHQEFHRFAQAPGMERAFCWPEYSFDDLVMNCRVGPHPMWRRELHAEVGYFDHRYKAIGDQDYWLRVGARHKLLHIPVFTGLAWLTKDSLSGQANALGEIYEIQHKHMRIHILRLRAELERMRDAAGRPRTVAADGVGR